jgi:peptidoglycan hydrolase CwlO-like protein
VVTLLIALLAAGGAGYAIAEIENTKDENREGNAAVNALRADVEVFREQTTERLDTVEGRMDDAADANTVRRLENELDAVDKRVSQLSRQDDQGGSQELETRIDELERRVEDLEEDSN